MGASPNVTGWSNLAEQFVIEMDRLGPFEPGPRLAVAVSGGADSMALVVLAAQWARQRGGDVLALTVDHTLREESSAEAEATLRSLTALGISGNKLTIANLPRGPALAERARAARYRLLTDACAAAGIAHLLLGHQVGDQAETVMMRALSGSTARGLAGMPALTETRYVRLLRPMLNLPPIWPRQMLAALGIPWIEDPSNRDPRALRSRLRAIHADPAGTGEGTHAVALAAARMGAIRAARDSETARVLARRASIRPEGYALLTPGPIEPEALAALLRTLAGAAHAPPIDRVAALARGMRPATLWGVRIAPAGRLGPGWLLVRERRALGRPVRGRIGAVWDGRFRLVDGPPEVLARNAESPVSRELDPDLGSDGLTIGALGADAAGFRNRAGLPTLVLHGLPALRLNDVVVAVPHIGMGDPRWRLLFDPRNCAAGAPFFSGLDPVGRACLFG